MSGVIKAGIKHAASTPTGMRIASWLVRNWVAPSGLAVVVNTRWRAESGKMTVTSKSDRRPLMVHDNDINLRNMSEDWVLYVGGAA